jgi:hypothetical protein
MPRENNLPALAGQKTRMEFEWLEVLDSATKHGLIERKTAEELHVKFAIALVAPDALEKEVADLLASGSAAEKALDAIADVFSPEDTVEIRALEPMGRGSSSLSGRLCVSSERHALVDFIRNHVGRWNLYFGINPRRAELAGTTQAGRAQDVVARRGMMLDIDLKDAPASDPDWRTTRVELQSLKPMMMVATGNGYQVWLPVRQLGEPGLAASVAPLAASMARIGADNTADLPRIGRLPFTVNLPTAIKRKRGNVSRLAVPLTIAASALPLPRTEGDTPDVTSLCAALDLIADRQALPGRGSADQGLRARQIGTGVVKKPWPAPSAELLTMAVRLIPNNQSHYDARDDFVALAMAIKGAAVAGNCQAKGKEAWLDFCERWDSGGDAVQDETFWDTCTNPRNGWGTVMRELERTNPDGATEVKSAAARFAFEQDDIVEVTEIADRMASGIDKGKTEGRSGRDFERAVKKIMKSGGRLFMDQAGAVWLDHQSRVLNVSSKDMRLFQIAHALGESLTGNARSSFIETLLNHVKPDVPREEVHFRQAQDTDAQTPVIYINRMDGGRGVKITPKGWTDVPLSDVSVHMTDRSGGGAIPAANNVRVAAEFLPLLEQHLPLEPLSQKPLASEKGTRQRAAVMALVVAAFWRPGTVPHFMITGQQGSGKTTLAKRLVDMTDPDVASVTSTLPREASNMFAVVAGRSVVTIDNASGLTKDTSDTLCALASGNAYAGRKLYTNAERSILRAKASVIFTSVLSDIVKMPDLSQRTLRFEPSPITSSTRRSEREMDAAWANDLPQIMGAMYNALVGMLGLLPGVSADVASGSLDTPRLQDAAIAAEAFARAVGWPDGLCMQALLANEVSSAARLLEDNPVAWRIRWIVQNSPTGEWKGSMTELAAAVESVPVFSAPPWDRSRVKFKGQYDRLWPSIENAWGIARETGKSGDRWVRLFVDPTFVVPCDV